MLLGHLRFWTMYCGPLQGRIKNEMSGRELPADCDKKYNSQKLFDDCLKLFLYRGCLVNNCPMVIGEFLSQNMTIISKILRKHNHSNRDTKCSILKLKKYIFCSYVCINVIHFKLL